MKYHYHIIAFLIGFVLDLLLGDPYSFPHPVKAMGKLINKLDRHFLGEKQAGSHEEYKSDGKSALTTDGGAVDRRKRRQGIATALIVISVTIIITALIWIGAYLIHPVLGVIAEAVMTYQALAAKCLYTESMKVHKALKTGSISDARFAVSMIVGRDTKELDEAGVTRAAVETVAESTCDGVIAPMLYLAVGGPVLGMTYKAVNTMDSMIGYKNERYRDFGRFAARFDDLWNLIPARFGALLMILSCLFLGKDYSMKRAAKVFARDRYAHSSPNSAHTESVCAGALGVRLAGDASYGGKIVHKPYIGDDVREPEIKDIRRANRLMYMTTVLCELLCLGAMLLAWYLITGRLH